jgi:hypothetical protein
MLQGAPKPDTKLSVNIRKNIESDIFLHLMMRNGETMNGKKPRIFYLALALMVLICLVSCGCNRQLVNDEV